MSTEHHNERADETQGEQDSPDFRSELTSLLNRYSRENASNTPDWILSDYICGCLSAFDAGMKQRDKWYGMWPEPGQQWMTPIPRVEKSDSKPIALERRDDEIADILTGQKPRKELRIRRDDPL